MDKITKIPNYEGVQFILTKTTNEYVNNLKIRENSIYGFCFIDNETLCKPTDEVMTDSYSITNFEYNENGLLIKEIHEYEYPAGDGVEIDETSYEYDDMGRKIKTLSSDGECTTISYENIINGEVKTTLSNLSEPITEIRYNSNNPDINTDVIELCCGDVINKLTYAPNGQLIRKTDSEGHQYSYVYNDNGILIEIYRDGQIFVKHVYDGETILSSSYDVDNVTGTSETITYNYDDDGNLITKVINRVYELCEHVCHYSYYPDGKIHTLELRFQPANCNNDTLDENVSVIYKKIYEYETDGETNITYEYETMFPSRKLTVTTNKYMKG